MQEKNIIANTYWVNNERFADIMNVGMFQEKVLIPEHLSEREGYLGHLEREKPNSSIQRNRDITKKAAFGTNFVILSGFSKDDKLQAVCTLVIYYGKDPWTGPKTVFWNDTER